MIFKPKKQYYQMMVFEFCMITVAFIILLTDDGDYMFILKTYWFVYFIFIRYWIATGRTFIMSKEGCIVKFLWYQKEYKWDDFQVKAIEDFSKAHRQMSSTERGAIFSKRPIHKPWWWEPAVYSINLHPLSFVFVDFIPPRKLPGEIGIYEIEEEVFVAKMKEWGIELEEINFYDR